MRILIVEDDRDLAAALDDALRFEGYATRVAYNGLEAVRMLAEQSIDIVLLDRDLPIMSGDAVMETIASNDIPVSVLMLSPRQRRSGTASTVSNSAPTTT